MTQATLRREIEALRAGRPGQLTEEELRAPAPQEILAPVREAFPHSTTWADVIAATILRNALLGDDPADLKLALMLLDGEEGCSCP